jgi:hypothetical protein
LYLAAIEVHDGEESARREMGQRIQLVDTSHPAAHTRSFPGLLPGGEGQVKQKESIVRGAIYLLTYGLNLAYFWSKCIIGHLFLNFSIACFMLFSLSGTE